MTGLPPPGYTSAFGYAVADFSDPVCVTYSMFSPLQRLMCCCSRWSVRGLSHGILSPLATRAISPAATPVSASRSLPAAYVSDVPRALPHRGAGGSSGFWASDQIEALHGSNDERCLFLRPGGQLTRQF